MRMGYWVSGVRVVVGLGVLVELVGGTGSSPGPGSCSGSLDGVRLGLNEWMRMHGY